MATIYYIFQGCIALVLARPNTFNVALRRNGFFGWFRSFSSIFPHKESRKNRPPPIRSDELRAKRTIELGLTATLNWETRRSSYLCFTYRVRLS
jgi:hypothetical protein